MMWWVKVHGEREGEAEEDDSVEEDGKREKKNRWLAGRGEEEEETEEAEEEAQKPAWTDGWLSLYNVPQIFSKTIYFTSTK